MRKSKFIMWGVFGRNGGLEALFRSKWKAQNDTSRDDQRIKKVKLELKEIK